MNKNFNDIKIEFEEEVDSKKESSKSTVNKAYDDNDFEAEFGGSDTLEIEKLNVNINKNINESELKIDKNEIKNNFVKINLPNFKDLGINIKSILKIDNPKTYKEFYNKWGEIFIFNLKQWCLSNNRTEDFEKIFEIVFFHGFINYCRERRLINLLTYTGFNSVRTSSMWEDGVIKIDAWAKTPKGTTVVFQVKPYYREEYLTLLGSLKTFCINSNAIPFLAIEYKDKENENRNFWGFHNLFNLQKIKLSEILEL